MEAISVIRKVGGSLVVTIPKPVVDAEGLTDHQTVRLDISKVKISGFGVFKNLPSFSKDDKMKGHFE